MLYQSGGSGPRGIEKLGKETSDGHAAGKLHVPLIYPKVMQLTGTYISQNMLSELQDVVHRFEEQESRPSSLPGPYKTPNLHPDFRLNCQPCLSSADLS